MQLFSQLLQTCGSVFNTIWDQGWKKLIADSSKQVSGVGDQESVEGIEEAKRS
jgi:hypothetical protein